MEIPKEINLSQITRTVMREIDLSRDVHYSALINGERIMSKTDGIIRPHMPIEEWVERVVFLYLERYNQLHEANK